MKSARQALLALQGAVLLFGGAGLLGKLVTSPPAVITGLRSLIAAAVLGALAAGQRRRCAGREVRTTPGWWPAVLAAGMLLAVHWWAFFAAVQLGSVTLGLLTYASYPLFALGLEPVCFRERLRPADLAAGAAVLAGLALVVPAWDFGTRPGRAVLCGLVAGLTFAGLSLLNRRLLRVRPALELVALETGVAGVVLLPWVAPALAAIPARDWLWLALLGVVFTGLAHWAFTAALARVTVRVAGITAALEPVYGVALAAGLLGEALPARTLVGGLLIVSAAILMASTTGPRIGSDDPGQQQLRPI